MSNAERVEKHSHTHTHTHSWRERKICFCHHLQSSERWSEKKYIFLLVERLTHKKEEQIVAGVKVKPLTLVFVRCSLERF